MTGGSQSRTGAPTDTNRRDADEGPNAAHRPEISVCESCPGRSVLLESGNTDGWIATDVVVDVRE